MHILITGGAGFIGSHVADQLLDRGHDVRVLDCLDAQVHPARTRPDYLDPRVALDRGDIRDPAAVRRALDGVDGVIHFAARVGVGQSMYEMPPTRAPTRSARRCSSSSSRRGRWRACSSPRA